MREHLSSLTHPMHRRALQAQARLSRRVDAQIFLEPVDPVRDQCPDYLAIIAKPMDMGTVATRLAAGEYSCDAGLGGHMWFADVKLIFDNAMVYNPVAHPVHRQARRLRAAFADAYVAILAKIEARLRRFGSTEVSVPRSHAQAHAPKPCKGRTRIPVRWHVAASSLIPIILARGTFDELEWLVAQRWRIAWASILRKLVQRPGTCR